MCGIVGIATLGGDELPSEPQLRRMCATILHRGPDDEGVFIHGRVGMGMRRLSIIDLAGGQQPIFNEDETICTVFNGEIYNFRELRRTLTAKGHRFRTASDTETIVHAYEQYGGDFPTHLNGMFAVCVYDSAKRRLTLARDHIGIKPLYYSLQRDYLVFGSEIKALLASGLIDGDLDVDGLGQFMAWEYVPGEQTLFNQIKKLEPGCILEIDLDNPVHAPRKFWDIPLSEEVSPLSPEDWENAIDAKITECVQRQMVSDVPLGAFLSGGVDSSLLVAAMGSAQTFSIGFRDQSYNELPYAQEVADHLGMNHIVENIEPEVAHLFDELMNYLDDPIGDFSIFPTYLVSRLARRHVKVVLSGDGGDELFGGYETYVANDWANRYESLPAPLRRWMIEPIVDMFKPTPAKKGLVNKAKRFVEGVHLPRALNHARWRLFASAAARQKLFTSDANAFLTTPVEHHITRLFDESGPRTSIDRCLYVDVKSYLSDNILTKVDRMSMAVSLEARVPYLDKELVELAFQTPDALKVAGGKTKVLLKRIAARYVPDRCVYRPKEGFSIPIKNWLGTQFRPLVDQFLNKRRLESSGIFEWSTVQGLIDQHASGAANNSHTLWSLIVFEAWRDRWLGKPAFSSGAPHGSTIQRRSRVLS